MIFRKDQPALFIDKGTLRGSKEVAPVVLKSSRKGQGPTAAQRMENNGRSAKLHTNTRVHHALASRFVHVHAVIDPAIQGGGGIGRLRRILDRGRRGRRDLSG